MLLNVLKRNGLQELRYIEVGHNVCGLRITSFVVEGPKEMNELLTPEGQKWLAQSMSYCFLPDNKQ